MSESKLENLSKSSEDQLNHLVNYLKFFSDKCSTLASISHFHHGDKYGQVEFYNWCAQDLNKMADQVIDYIKKRGGKVHPEDIIACKFNIDSEKKVDLNILPPIELLDYLHKEDKHYNDKLNEMIKFASNEGDINMKDLVKGLKDELEKWNAKFDDSIKILRSANASTKMNPNDLENVFKSQFNEIKKFREI